MEADLLIVIAQYGTEYHLQDHAADVASHIDTLASFGAQLPFLEQGTIDSGDQFGEGADWFAVERRLDHPPLSLPKVPFAHHQAVAQKEGIA